MRKMFAQILSRLGRFLSSPKSVLRRLVYKRVTRLSSAPLGCQLFRW